MLSEFRVEEKDERGVPKHIIIKNINRYLSWDSINDLALNLNPNEPTSVVIGKLVNKQVVLSGFEPKSHFFEVPYFFDSDQWGISSELIQQNSFLGLRFFSENADVYCLDIKLTWPEKFNSEKELSEKLKLGIERIY